MPASARCAASISSSTKVTGAIVSKGNVSNASANRLGTNFGVSTSSIAPISAARAREPVTSAPTLLPMTWTSFPSNIRSNPSSVSSCLDRGPTSSAGPALFFQPTGISTTATNTHCESEPTFALASSHRRSTLNSYRHPGGNTTGGWSSIGGPSSIGCRTSPSWSHLKRKASVAGAAVAARSSTQLFPSLVTSTCRVRHRSRTKRGWSSVTREVSAFTVVVRRLNGLGASVRGRCATGSFVSSGLTQRCRPKSTVAAPPVCTPPATGESSACAGPSNARLTHLANVPSRRNPTYASGQRGRESA